MLAVLLAIASSVGYGAADFAGGLASRRMHVLRVVVAAAPAGLVVTIALLPILGAEWSMAALAWGGLSGVASAAAFGLLYRTLALGPMSLLSPLTAVISALIPVLVGLAEGERLGIGGLAGLAAALIAIVLIGGPITSVGRPATSTLALATGAGIAIACQLICFHQAPPTSGVAPLVAGGLASSVILMGAAALRRGSLGPASPGLTLAAFSGVLSAIANLAFLVAVRDGDLAVVAVITALYPATTVVLARGILGERLIGLQALGLLAATIAVCALAVG